MSEQRIEQLAAALDAMRVELDPDFVDQLRQDFRREAASSADSPIIQTDDLGEPVMTKLDTQSPEGSDTDLPRKWWSSRLPLGLAAAGVLVVVGLAVGISALQDDDEVTPAGDAQTFGTESALETVEAYFVAYNAGDLDSVLALFTDEATFSDSFSSSEVRPVWEPRLAWDLAHERAFTSPDCSVVDEVPGSTVTVACEFASRSAVEVAAGVDVPITATIAIAPEGIADLHERVGSPDYTIAGGPFSRWAVENHPEDGDLAGCCEGETVEESILRGELRAAYAKEWGEFLDDNG